MKFSAVLHGADPASMEDKEEAFKTTNDNLMFGDPAEYEKLDEEEKKRLSDKMRNKFYQFAGVRENGRHNG